MFAIIVLVGYACAAIGVLIYEKFLKEWETRDILFWNVILTIVSTFLMYCFVMRWNLEVGISDYCFIFCGDVFMGAIATAF
mmetsp:Transcript_30065/g.45945  ORF Transcript_30065/g.45945 Transcript_30065/m.45945 type:complete len:81 (-) Transcript_30065:325-567(-)